MSFWNNIDYCNFSTQNLIFLKNLKLPIRKKILIMNKKVYLLIYDNSLERNYWDVIIAYPLPEWPHSVPTPEVQGICSEPDIVVEFVK